MPRRVLCDGFVEQLRQQLDYLRDETYAYRALHVYVAGVSQPWVFEAGDEFEFHEDTGVLIVRDGPTGEDGHDNEDVPEYVFRLESVVATQLV